MCTRVHRWESPSDFASARSGGEPQDGTPLANSEASITGLVNGETATVTATGTITEVGTTDNTYTIEWGTAKSSNYEVTEELGTLEVTEAEILGSVTITAGSASKTYDGRALTAASYTVEGLSDGYTCTASVTGSQTDAGESVNSVSAYTITDAGGNDVTSSFDVTTANGTLTVSKAKLTVTTGSIDKVFDGEALTNSEASIDGLISGETATVTATGSITDAGSTNNTYTIEWGTAKESNYTIHKNLGKLTVTPLIITFNLWLPAEDWYEGEPAILISERIDGYYDYESDEVPGTEISGEDAEYVYDEEEALVSVYRDFHLKGGGEVRIQCDTMTIESAGEYTMTPVQTFTGGKSGNYSITYVHETTIFRKLG